MLKRLLAPVLVGVAVGCVPTVVSAVGSTSPASVTLLGDSMTILSEPSIAEDLFPAAAMTSYAHNAWTTRQVGAYAGPALAAQPLAVIVNLGTNDALQNDPSAVSDLTAIVDEVAAANVPCVAFVTITQLPDLQAGNTVGADVDNYIAGLPSSHPGWKVIPWWAWSSGHASEALSSYDGIHPASAGQAWLGSQYGAFVNACLAA